MEFGFGLGTRIHKRRKPSVDISYMICQLILYDISHSYAENASLGAHDSTHTYFHKDVWHVCSNFEDRGESSSWYTIRKS